MKHPSLPVLLALALAAGATALWWQPDPTPDARLAPPPGLGSVLGAGGVPFDAPAFLARAGDALSAGRWSQAAELLGDLVRADPRDHEAWMLLGFVLHEDGRHIEALYALEQAARDATTRPAALVQRAAALAALGRTHDALGALEAAVSAGFSNRALVQRDADLDPLRTEPRFAALLRELPEHPVR